MSMIMDCPRCRLSLEVQDYESQHILFCRNCWGFWVEARQLQRILEEESARFSRRERATIFQTFADRGAAAVVDDSAAIQCPSCGNEMHRRAFADDCPVVVDCCPEHGYWLDTGEIKALQVFVERRA